MFVLYVVQLIQRKISCLESWHGLTLSETKDGVDALMCSDSAGRTEGSLAKVSLLATRVHERASADKAKS